MNETSRVSLAAILFLAFLLASGPAQAADEGPAGSAAAESAAPKEERTQVTAGAGKGVTISGGEGNFLVNFSAYVQPFYHFTSVDGADHNSSNFRILRARVEMKGHAFRPWLEYRLLYETAGTAGLRDFYVDVGRYRWSSLRAGQFKVPFSLQAITSDPRLQFVNREFTHDANSPDRDQGVDLHGQSARGFFGYDAGIFNGNGINKTESSKPNTDHLTVVRLHLDPRGEYPLVETLPKAPEHLLWTVGLGGFATKVPATTSLPRFDRQATNLYSGVKIGRFSWTGEMFRRWDHTTDAALSPDVQSRSYYVQSGFYVIPGRLEVAARAADVDPDSASPRDDNRMVRAGLNLYFSGHEHKLQFDAGRIYYGRNNPDLLQSISSGQRNLTAGVDDATDTDIRLLYQVIF